MSTQSHLEQLEDEHEHVVPTHLSTPDRVGWLTVRQLNVLLGPAFFISPAGWLLGQPAGLGASIVGATLPLLMGGAFALPLQPPLEHGLQKLILHQLRKKTLGPKQMPA